MTCAPASKLAGGAEKMMTNGMTVDLREFNQALTEYVAFTGKDAAYALNRAMKNIAFKAIAFVKAASRDDILSLLGAPRLFAWMLRKRAEAGGFQGFQQRHSTRYEQRMIQRGKRAGQFRQVKVGSDLNFGTGKFYTVPFAREFSTKLVQARSRRVGFLKSFWFRLARALQASIPGGGQRGQAREIPAIVPGVKLASVTDLTVAVSAVYSYQRPKVESRKAEAILAAALQPAIDATTADMTKFIEDGMAKRARQMSATGVRVGRALAG